MANINNDYTPLNSLTPFKLCVLQNFPFIEADFDAVTNYQLLCKVVEYLNKVIDNNNKQNSNITHLEQNFITLYNYVKDYFDNLDVQKEINNKLDEMVADGTLDKIINQNIFGELNNKLNNTNYYTLEYFGCDNTGATSINTNLLKALEFAKNNNVVLHSKGGTYLLTEDVNIEDNWINMEFGTFTGDYSITIENGGILNANFNKTKCVLDRKSTLKNCKFLNFSTAITSTELAYETFVEDIRFENNEKVDTTVCVLIEGSDCSFNNLFGYGGHKGIVIKGSNNRISNAHLWLNANNNWTNSVFIEISGVLNSILNSCCDSYFRIINNTVVNLTNYYEIMWTNNTTLFNNKEFASFNQMLATGYVIFRLTGQANANNKIYCDRSYGLRVRTIDGDLTSYYYAKLPFNIPNVTTAFNDSYVYTDGYNIEIGISVTPQSTLGSLPDGLTISLSGLMNRDKFGNSASFPVIINLSGNTTKTYIASIYDNAIHIPPITEKFYSIVGNYNFVFF